MSAEHGHTGRHRRSPSYTPLNLGELGRQLDEERQTRSRNLDDFADLAMRRRTSSADTDTSDEQDIRSSMRRTHLSSVEEAPDVSDNRPLPLCLLCLIRPPTAVLLPCCHLNLCYLCAPLLLQQRNKMVEPIAASLPIIESTDLSPPAESRPSRIPFNQALLRATANHPKSRRLSFGAYLPPPLGTSGAEHTADDLLALRLDDSDDRPAARANSTHLTSRLASDGRLTLSQNGPETVRCPLCRTGVRGWLRVYTG